MTDIRNVASSGDPSTGLLEVTYTGLPDGMAPAIPPHQLPDTMARLIVDAFVHNPGLIARRGPVTALPGFSELSYSASGMASVVDPQGSTRVGVFHGDASHGYLRVYSTDFSTSHDLPLGVNLPTSPYQIVQVGARLYGGVYLTIQDKTTQGANQYLLVWKGSGLPAYTTGTLTATLGSTTVTGSGTSWQDNTEAGAFMFAGGKYVGCVKTVTADGVLTLEDNALATVSASAYSVQPFRGINPRVGKGYITTDAAGSTVNGANTKFSADGMGTGTWDIFRSSDYMYIGTVSSVTSDIQLQLVSNATTNLAQEPYTAIHRDGTYQLSPEIGVITAIWAGRQAYANNSSTMTKTSEVWLSSVDDAESLDEARTDGDSIQVPSTGPAGTATSMVAMVTTPSSLLLLKENEAYALFGATTSQFNIQTVSSDDGCLSPMSVQSWNGLTLYAGRQGIHMYDGTQDTNLTQDRLGWWYQSALTSFDATTHRMWSALDRDHYLLFIESVAPPIPVMKGSVSQAQTSFTIAIHLPTSAVTVLSNVNMRGSLRLPSALGHNTWYVVNNASGKGVICSADTLFDSAGNDDFGCDGGTAGPDFYIETKKYTMGDALLKKLWKLFLLTYMATGDSLRLDTVPGMNEQGAQSTTVLPATGLTWQQVTDTGLKWSGQAGEYPTWASPVSSQFITKRIKFLKRTQMMSFRIYQNSSSVKAVSLGPWSVVVKPQRIGRT